MAKYIRNPGNWEAEKWKGHEFVWGLDVPVYRQKGVTGYSAKIGLYKDHNGNEKTLRPNEYLLISESGEITSMNANTFELEFTIANKKKVSHNNKKTEVCEDNSII